jgi:capsular polysaccharide biosynthesis protein
VSNAYRSAKRRKLLSFLIAVMGGALTFAASKLAPRDYSASGEVLVVKSILDERQSEAVYMVGALTNEQKEWLAQIQSQPTIENVIKDAQLVARWDATRPPLGRLSDSLKGRQATDDEKAGAAAFMLETRLKANIEPPRITVTVDWPEPTTAADIVNATITRFIDSRFSTEVQPYKDAIKIKEEQREDSRVEMEKILPTAAPPPAKDVTPKVAGPAAPGLSDADRAKIQEIAGLRDKLAQIRNQLRPLEEGKAGRVADVQEKLTHAKQTYAEQHPQILSLNAQLQAAQRDTAEMSQLRQQAAGIEQQLTALGTPRVAPSSQDTSKSKDKDKVAAKEPEEKGAVQKYEFYRQNYDAQTREIDDLGGKYKTAEAAFKKKYTISRAAVPPRGPKKPIGLTVALGGTFATILLILLLAAVADRMSGIFYEPKHVRDLLRLPVLGEFRRKDFSA